MSLPLLFMIAVMTTALISVGSLVREISSVRSAIDEAGVDAIENHVGKIAELGGLVVEQAHRAGICLVADRARDAGVSLKRARVRR